MKKKINKSELIEKINEEIKLHSQYENGMRVEMYPDSSKASGYVAINCVLKPKVVADAASIVNENYELVL